MVPLRASMKSLVEDYLFHFIAFVCLPQAKGAGNTFADSLPTPWRVRNQPLFNLRNLWGNL
jgi:hypothetical protein